MQNHANAARACAPHSPVDAVSRLMLDQRRLATVLRAQMWQAHWSVRGEGRIVAHGVFAQVADCIGELVGLLSARIAQRGVLATPASGAPTLLRSYPIGVANEHAHAFAASGALAIVAQMAREDAGKARALDDAPCARLLDLIACRVDAQIWLVQCSLELPVVTAIFAMYSGPHVTATGDRDAISSGAASALEIRDSQHEAAPHPDCRG